MDDLSESSWEAVDHTADLALRVRAPDLEALFTSAAHGLLGFLTDPGQVKCVDQQAISVTGIDLEELLVMWLGEVLYLEESESRLFSVFIDLQITRCPETSLYQLSAIGQGEQRDPERHIRKSAVKAVTYHGLVIPSCSEKGYDLTIVFDT